MASDDIDLDRADIDRLVKELANPLKPPPPPRPVFAAKAIQATPPPSATPPGALAPGRSWSTGTLLMPAMLYSGKTHRSWHVPLAVVFSVLWAGTFVTGIFFLPYSLPKL